jgi:hypothetical protein
LKYKKKKSKISFFFKNLFRNFEKIILEFTKRFPEMKFEIKNTIPFKLIITISNTFKSVISIQYPNEKIDILLIQCFSMKESIDQDTSCFIFKSLNDSLLYKLNKHKKEKNHFLLQTILVIFNSFYFLVYFKIL